MIEADGSVRDGQVADISEGGVLALLASPIESGAKATLRMCLPVSGRVVALAGVVRWSRQARNRHAIGLEFTELAGEAAEEIRRFVELTTSTSTKGTAS